MDCPNDLVSTFPSLEPVSLTSQKHFQPDEPMLIELLYKAARAAIKMPRSCGPVGPGIVLTSNTNQQELSISVPVGLKKLVVLYNGNDREARHKSLGKCSIHKGITKDSY